MENEDTLDAFESETVDDGPIDVAAIEEELLIEEISIDGMCGVY